MRSLALALVAIVVAGCAVTAQSRGERALVQGDFVAARAEFEAALAEHPDRVGALLGLAVAHYKMGALAEAAASFDRVLAQAPQSGTALLYGGLAALQQKRDDVAADRLTRFRAIEPDPRFGAQVDRALALVKGPPVTDEVRTFVATSIEDAARATMEVRAAQSEAARAWTLSTAYPVRCYPTRRGGLVCL
ncbi:MAG TPA: tetratricopeptide repeat protein [Methylomirabilota bacterium]|nr:tetratricopeptide repeat protein [Methylomirabilota bacterium]